MLLLDEPFGQIDNLRKNSLRRMLFAYLKDKNISCIVATHDSNDALSFADQMIVLNDGKIVAGGTPENLYRDPKSSYVASFFDDINEVVINRKKVLLYPHQLKIVENSPLKATVLKNYYKGFYWLTEMNCKGQIIFVHHDRKIEPEKLFHWPSLEWKGHILNIVKPRHDRGFNCIFYINYLLFYF